MKQISIITVIISLLLPFFCIAKEKQESYNMQRAMECVQDYEFDKAMEYAQRELSANPKNAKACDLLGYLYARNEEISLFTFLRTMVYIDKETQNITD